MGDFLPPIFLNCLSALHTEEYISVAKLGKTHALGGMLNIYFEVGVVDDSINVLFVKENNGYIPYFVEKLDIHGEKGYVLFEEIKSKEAAQKLVNKEVYCKAKIFNQYFEPLEDELLALIGYTAFNGHHRIGEIREIYDNTAQLLAEIEHDQGTVLVPLIEEFIVSIDDNKKIVILDLPEGILEL